MINLYILNGNFTNDLGSFCSDSVYRMFSEKSDLTKASILCIKSKDSIPNEFLEKENFDIILDLLNSLYPFQYKISVVDNYKKGSVFKMNKKEIGKECLLSKFYNQHKYNACIPVDENIKIPFGDRSAIFKDKTIKASLIKDGSLNSFLYIKNDKIKVIPFNYEMVCLKEKQTIFDNQITFKIEYLTKAKNYNCHSCWQLFNSVLRMIDNPFEQGILRTYINLRKNKKYKDLNKFFLFGFACAFPDHNINLLDTYDNSYFNPARGTYGHLTTGSYTSEKNHYFRISRNGKSCLPIFKTKIDVDEIYRKNWISDKLIFDESLVSENHTSNESFTERSTGAYVNIFNKNYTGVLSEFNIVDYLFNESKPSNISDLYDEVDKYINIANIYIGNVKPEGELFTCIKENRSLGFFKGNKYLKLNNTNNYYNEFNFIEEIKDESIFKK